MTSDIIFLCVTINYQNYISPNANAKLGTLLLIWLRAIRSLALFQLFLMVLVSYKALFDKPIWSWSWRPFGQECFFSHCDPITNNDQIGLTTQSTLHSKILSLSPSLSFSILCLNLNLCKLSLKWILKSCHFTWIIGKI